MPTAIDELVVEVGLDGSRFAEGRRGLDEQFERSRRSLEAFGRDVERSGQRISDVFGFMKRGVVGLVGAFVGGEAAAFIDRIATMDAHTSRLARSIGISTRELSVWQNMVKMVGGTAEDASSTFGGLNDIFQQMRMGNAMPSAPFAALLGRAGVDWRNASPDQAMMQIMQFLATQSPRDQRFWLQQIPGMNENMMFLMMEGAKNMARFREEVERIGVASDQSAAQAKELQERTGELDTALDNLARVGFPLLTTAANAVTAALEVLTTTTGNDAINAVKRGAAGAWGWLTDPRPGSLRELWGAMTGTSAVTPPSSGGSRGDRNNNPGNVKYGAFAIAHGATGADSGGFAIFPDFHAGASAAAALLNSAYQGLTLAQIQKRWVGNVDEGYLGGMMKATGLRAGDVPNLNDPNTVAAVMRGIMSGEGTHVPRAPSSSTTNKTSSVNIGTINVSSAKADPAAVADAIPDSVRRYSMLGGINSGLT
jgi:hypothetical protein